MDPEVFEHKGFTISWNASREEYSVYDETGTYLGVGWSMEYAKRCVDAVIAEREEEKRMIEWDDACNEER